MHVCLGRLRTTRRVCWCRAFSSVVESNELQILPRTPTSEIDTITIHEASGVSVQRHHDAKRGGRGRPRQNGLKPLLKAAMEPRVEKDALQEGSKSRELEVGHADKEVVDHEPLNRPSQGLTLRQQREVTAQRRAEVMLENPDMLEMHPDRLALQQDFLSASSVGRILALCSQEELEKMDLVNLVTACQRLAKLHHGSNAFLKQNPRFEMLMAQTGQRLSELKPRGMVHVLWSVVKLQHFPGWFVQLSHLCQTNLCNFTGRELSVILGALAKVPKSMQEPKLQEDLVMELKTRLPELQSPTDIACVAAALCRLQSRDELLFANLAANAQKNLMDFSMSDMLSVLWAFASMNLTHSDLFAEVRKVLHQQVESCSPKELTQITWALSRLKEADEDLLCHVIAPVVREKMMDFEVPRDLCTLAFAYSNAKVMDEGLFSDLAHVLSSKVRLMNAHDISSVVAAFSTIEYAHKSLFKALQRHTKATLKTFSPLQLARTIHGFGIAGVEDPALYRQLCNEVMKKKQDLHAKNIVEILIGLAEAEFVPESAMTLLEDVDVCRWLDAKDCIQALHALVRLPQLESKAFRLEVLKVIRKRSQGWWRFEINDMADLIEATVALKIEDHLLFKLCLGQLPRLLGKDHPPSAFLRLWGALSELPKPQRQQMLEEVHRNRRLRQALEVKVQESAAAICRLFPSNESDEMLETDTSTAVKAGSQLLVACASLGWDLHVHPLVDALDLFLDESTWTSLHGDFVWAICELGLHTLAQKFLEGSSLSSQNSDQHTLERFLEVSASAGKQFDAAERPTSSSATVSKVDEVSQALLDLELPHEKYLLLGDHDVDIRLQDHTLLLVLAPKHLMASGRPLGSTIARRRQLEAMGFTVLEIDHQEVDAAAQGGKLQETLRTWLKSEDR